MDRMALTTAAQAGQVRPYFTDASGCTPTFALTSDSRSAQGCRRPTRLHPRKPVRERRQYPSRTSYRPAGLPQASGNPECLKSCPQQTDDERGGPTL